MGASKSAERSGSRRASTGHLLSPVGIKEHPMQNARELFENNRQWSEGIKRRDPEFFQRLSRQQSPRYLWIGCSDSRVPANQVVGLDPGELFVHRNVANLVVHTDLNCLSVMQYAVDVLEVEHIIVCGHYGCGGIQAALSNERLGLIDNWLRHVQDIRDKHIDSLQRISDRALCARRLCELNVVEQIANICRTTIVQDAWARKRPLSVCGWIYALTDGRLRDLNMYVTEADALSASYLAACSALAQAPPALQENS
jgi:carbonic anhydrase